MTRRLEVGFAWAGLIILLILHLDFFWRGDRPALFFDAVPEELAYRVGWMILAWLYLLFFTARIWRDET